MPQIAWPVPCPGASEKTGYIIGWRSSTDFYTVLAVVPIQYVAQPTQLATMLESLGSIQMFAKMTMFCGGLPPCILGIWNPDKPIKEYSRDFGDENTFDSMLSIQTKLMITVEGAKLYCCSDSKNESLILCEHAQLDSMDIPQELKKALRFGKTIKNTTHFNYLPVICGISGNHRSSAHGQTAHIVLFRAPNLRQLEHYSFHPHTNSRHYVRTPFELTLNQINTAPLFVTVIQQWVALIGHYNLRSFQSDVQLRSTVRTILNKKEQGVKVEYELQNLFKELVAPRIVACIRHVTTDLIYLVHKTTMQRTKICSGALGHNGIQFKEEGCQSLCSNKVNSTAQFDTSSAVGEHDANSTAQLNKTASVAGHDANSTAHFEPSSTVGGHAVTTSLTNAAIMTDDNNQFATHEQSNSTYQSSTDLHPIVTDTTYEEDSAITPISSVSSSSSSCAQYLRDSHGKWNKKRTQTPKNYILKIIFFPVLFCMMLIRIAAGFALFCLNFQPPAWTPILGSRPLRQVSVFGKQLDRKCREYCTWPSVLVHLRTFQGTRKPPFVWHRPQDVVEHHVAVYSSMSLAVLDVLIGVGIGLFLIQNAEAGGHVLKGIHRIVHMLHIDVLRHNIEWLMGLPAGLKVNYAVATRVGSAILEGINAWNTITTFLTPFEPLFVLIFGICGSLGVTLIFALAADLLELATWHIYFLRAVFAKIHGQHVTLLGSLWRLFRGKKWNILRSRVDSAQVDTPQLLLGTLLFACVFFLFPTWFAYYAFFSLVWLFILFVRAILWMALSILNRFPFYALFLRLSAPLAMPGSISLCRINMMVQSITSKALKNSTKQPSDNSGEKITIKNSVICLHQTIHDMQRSQQNKLNKNLQQLIVPSTYLFLQPAPASIGRIFNVYAPTWKQLVAHYNPKRILRAAFLGEYVPQSPETEDDFRPDVPPPSIREYWSNLCTLLFTTSTKDTFNR